MAVPTRAALAALLLALSACSPTFNWRDWAVEGTPLKATLPCKPEAASRPVPMLGTPVALHMLSCEAGGLRFALAWAEIAEAGQAAQALTAWQGASLQSLRATAAPGDPALIWPVGVPGVSQVTGLQAQGVDPQGQPVQARQAYFSRGRQIFQVAVYGERVDAAVTEAFFGGLRLPSP